MGARKIYYGHPDFPCSITVTDKRNGASWAWGNSWDVDMDGLLAVLACVEDPAAWIHENIPASVLRLAYSVLCPEEQPPHGWFSLGSIGLPHCINLLGHTLCDDSKYSWVGSRRHRLTPNPPARFCRECLEKLAAIHAKP